MTLLSLGDVLDCSKGFSLEKLLDKPVVLELDGMMDDTQNFFVEILLAWIYHYRLAQGQRGKFRHAIIFDEAKKVFDKNKERSPESGLPVIDMITDRAREFGEAMIVADQELSKLTDSIKSNTCTKLMLSMVNGDDINHMAGCMGLDREQRSEAHILSPGEAVARTAGHAPCKIEIPLMRLTKDVSNSEVEECFKKHCLTYEKRKENNEQPIPVVFKCKEEEGKLSKDAEKILVSINDEPFIPVSSRYPRLGLSIFKGNRAKKELVTRGYVKEIEVDMLIRGGRPKIYELTEKGRDYLLLELFIQPRVWGKGGTEHCFWQHRIKRYYERWGCNAQVEVFIGKKSVDVVVKCPNGKWTAVEIAMSPEYEIENIKKNLKLGFEEIIVACKNKKVLAIVQKIAEKKLRRMDLRNIRFVLFGLFNTDSKETGSVSTPSAS